MRPALRHVLTHLLTPLLMCLGMGLAYLGAFADPSPHHLPVAVVGSGPRAQVLAQSIEEKAGQGRLEVRTVASRAEAVHQLQRQQVFGAYVPDRRAPELLTASAGSDTTASVVQKVFAPVAARQQAPLKVTDVVPPAGHDPTGQGIFFLLVALSIGSYASVAVIGGAGAALPMRIRALLAAATSLVVSLIGVMLAKPVFHLVDHGLWGVWGMAWLYSAGVLLIGTGLHTFLKRWTTLGLMVLFVMLNFTSSGGVFRPEMQSGFFAALHSFWNGAGFVEGVRSLVYFGHAGLSGHLWTLGLWLLAGLVAVALAWGVESRRTGVTAPAAEAAESEEAEEEMAEAVGV
ncbi:hypothetical protein ACIHFE_15425 [Streptomyces sp. NPDC052396]|uniref:hypothetical protein n=1 Tax=Streptomyces sp. NPDC052396 TaxID=3365689 RepID=UPI0037D498D5